MRIKLYPIKTREEFENVCHAAIRDDRHNTIQPSHWVQKDGHIVGAVSIGPTVWWWLNSALDKRDSYEMWVAVETLLRDRGISQYIILLPHDSPYNRVVDSAGFEKIEDTQILWKRL